jgi:hypothetical protein
MKVHLHRYPHPSWNPIFHFHLNASRTGVQFMAAVLGVGVGVMWVSNGFYLNLYCPWYVIGVHR